MAQIAVRNITIAYENKVAVDHVSFAVEAGDYLCIIGENGSGKSTLLKGLLGLIKPRSGEIILEARLPRNEIGYIPQQTVVQKDFPASVFEVTLSGCLNSRGLRPFYSQVEKARARASLEKLSVLDLKDKSYRDLSGGQQQRVLLARALCAAGKVLVLDEPVTGLDPAATSDLYEIVQRLNAEGMTIIMVSHDVTGVLGQARTVMLMEDGGMKFFGTPEEYMER